MNKTIKKSFYEINEHNKNYKSSVQITKENHKYINTQESCRFVNSQKPNFTFQVSPAFTANNSIKSIA